MNKETTLREFEKWTDLREERVSGYKGWSQKYPDGDYIDIRCRNAWAAWQAALSTP